VSQLNRRQALRLFGAVGVAGAAAPLLSACTTGNSIADSQQAAENIAPVGGPPVKIGFIYPKTGSNADNLVGVDMINGFTLYLRQVGNKLNGRDVNLVIGEEGATADAGRAAVEKLIKQEKVAALVGVVRDDTMLAVKDLVESSQVPLIGSNASPSALQGVKYIWRTSFVDTEPGSALGPWVAKNNPGSLAVLSADVPDKTPIRSFLDAYSTAHGDLASGYPKYTPNTAGATADFANVLAGVRSSGATGIFAYYTGDLAVAFVKAVKAANFGSGFKVWGPGMLTEGYVLKQESDNAKGIFTAMNYSPDIDNTTNRVFVTDYQKAYTLIPSSYAMASYDAAAVLDKAIGGVAGDLTPVSLNQAIGRLGQVESPRGSWQFSQNRTPQQTWYLRKVELDGNVLSNVLAAELTTMG
jgi:branched-chain amino acid transport system substrate-binding protein